jgi:hypothetical protein
MTDAVEIAIIGAIASSVAAVAAGVTAFFVKRANDRVVALDVKVDGRLTELLAATNAQGRQDERDSHSITVRGVPETKE